MASIGRMAQSITGPMGPYGLEGQGGQSYFQRVLYRKVEKALLVSTVALLDWLELKLLYNVQMQSIEQIQRYEVIVIVLTKVGGLHIHIYIYIYIQTRSPTALHGVTTGKFNTISFLNTYQFFSCLSFWTLFLSLTFLEDFRMLFVSKAGRFCAI